MVVVRFLKVDHFLDRLWVQCNLRKDRVLVSFFESEFELRTVHKCVEHLVLFSLALFPNSHEFFSTSVQCFLSSWTESVECYQLFWQQGFGEVDGCCLVIPPLSKFIPSLLDLSSVLVEHCFLLLPFLSCFLFGNRCHWMFGEGLSSDFGIVD